MTRDHIRNVAFALVLVGATLHGALDDAPSHIELRVVLGRYPTPAHEVTTNNSHPLGDRALIADFHVSSALTVSKAITSLEPVVCPL